MVDLFIPVILGTTREGRQSEKVANLIVEVGARISGVKTELVDPIKLEISRDTEKDPKYTKLTEKADGFVIVTPEYNHSYPGSLKMLLDSELKNYIHKPVMMVGVSAGSFGGTRAIQSLVLTVRELGMITTFSDLQFPKVQDIFDEKGKLTDENFLRRINDGFTELIWMAKTLKHGRENFESKYH